MKKVLLVLILLTPLVNGMDWLKNKYNEYVTNQQKMAREELPIIPPTKVTYIAGIETQVARSSEFKKEGEEYWAEPIYVEEGPSPSLSCSNNNGSYSCSIYRYFTGASGRFKGPTESVNGPEAKVIFEKMQADNEEMERVKAQQKLVEEQRNAIRKREMDKLLGQIRGLQQIQRDTKDLSKK